MTAEGVGALEPSDVAHSRHFFLIFQNSNDEDWNLYFDTLINAIF